MHSLVLLLINIKDNFLAYILYTLLVIYFASYFYYRLIKKYPSSLEAMNREYSKYPLKTKGIFVGITIAVILFLFFFFVYVQILDYYGRSIPFRSLSRNQFNVMVACFVILCGYFGYLIGLQLEARQEKKRIEALGKGLGTEHDNTNGYSLISYSLISSKCIFIQHPFAHTIRSVGSADY